MTPILPYLEPKLVFFFDAKDRDNAIFRMTTLCQEAGIIDDAEGFYQAVIEREKIVTTGIGMGVAIPHAKLPNYDRFFIAIGVLSKGVDWKALDGAAVRLIFLIGGPDDKQTEYLKLLSSLTLLLKDEEKRKKLLTLSSAEAVLELFE